MSNHLTLHILASLPWNNLNRDDTGTPKRMRQGGSIRGLLSSQSIKRAARVDYENRSLDVSCRSVNVVDKVLERALEISPSLDEKSARKDAENLVGSLSKGEKGKAGGKRVSGWLSSEELETVANIVAEKSSETEFIHGHKTGSLAIAAFGRMFAAAPGNNTEAAIAVSPAVSTHPVAIETDYFTTVDDFPNETQGAGASHLGIASYTSGTFYRTVTIDRNQLKESWSGLTAPDAAEKLGLLLDALIYKLPKGKKNSTAPYTMPLLVLAEEQKYRMAYDFETPVKVGDEGGYTEASIKRIIAQRKAALQFDPDAFAGVTALAGTADPELLDEFNIPVSTKQDLIDQVVQWIRQ
ncbi:MAG: type I-E CRISPR-associated protein Cas7/Cse4/CasC [Actinomycetaceae bacterium]|nr:type I-E CRISPR-associated protein Cas7/Cse4/CasC [Actinomycetaceae bacterium]